MWEAGGSGVNEGSNEIRVLLVDHDKDCLFYTAKVLESCSYKVTTVENASTALSILSERKEDLDVVIADVHLTDLDAFTLLRLTVNMDVPAILMSADKDDTVVRRALENGAFLFLEKPVFGETMKYLGQHVMREKMIMRNKAQEKYRGNGKLPNESKGKMAEEDIGSETKNRRNEKNGPKKKVRGRKVEKKDKESELEKINNGGVKRKICTEWTDDLHAKFKDAVNQLGEGRCYPKDILELMNIPGLTRMQVASHLQKCRNDNWRNADERKSNLNSAPTTSVNGCSKPRINPKKFGSMPVLDKKFTNAHYNPQNGLEENHETPEIHSSQPHLLNQGFNSYSFTQNATNRTGGKFDIHNQTEMSNVSVIEKFAATALDMTNEQAYLSDLGSATSATDNSRNTSSHHKQPPDNFFDFIPEMDEFVQNLYGLPQSSIINQSSRTQGVIHFNQFFSNQLSMMANGQRKANRVQTHPYGESVQGHPSPFHGELANIVQGHPSYGERG